MKTAEELQKEFGVTQEQMDKAFGNYTCPKCKAISEQIGLCKACMIPPRPATAQPSAAKSPEEYAKLVGGMATGVNRRNDVADAQIAADKAIDLIRAAAGDDNFVKPKWLGITDVERVFPPVEFYRHTFDLSAAAMDRRASDRANDKAPKPVLGKCPRCSYGWLLADLESCLNRKLYAGEELMCSYCLHPVTAIPVDPNQTTPEMTESHWAKIDRLELELAAAKGAITLLEKVLDDRLKKHDETLDKWSKTQDSRNVIIVERDEYKKSGQILHEKLIAAEAQLNEARAFGNRMQHRAQQDSAAFEAMEKELAAVKETAKKDDEFRVKTINKLNDQLKAKDDELTGASELMDVIQQNLDKTEKEFTRINYIAQDRGQSLIKLAEELHQAKEKIKDREMTMAVKDDRIRALETDNKFLEKRCDEANDYAKNASAKLAELEEKLEHGIKQEHDLLEKAMHNAREEIRRLWQENETLALAKKYAENRIVDLQQNAISYESDKAINMKKDLQKARAACARLRQQAEGLQAQLKNAVEDREAYKSDASRYSVEVANSHQEAEISYKFGRFWFILWFLTLLAFTSVCFAWKWSK